MPHLDAAYDLARWLTRNGPDAEDTVQEAFVRALRFFDTYRGTQARSWLLAIVRNCYFQRLEQLRPARADVPFDEEIHTGMSAGAASEAGARARQDPETAIRSEERRQVLRSAIERLPAEFREIIVLRELESLSYREISDVLGVPIGTVMSRLARARKKLQQNVSTRMLGEAD